MIAPIQYDPAQYRACPICKCRLGERCYSRSGRVVDGRPDGVAVYTATPHLARKRRTAKPRAFTSAPLAY